MIRFTNCKINIGLDVVRRRPDGYHDLVTVMLQVPWHDIIEILPSKGSANTLTVKGRPVDCPPEKNLIMKAARKIQELRDLPALDIILQKIVPDGAGLGGGSGDAAATILLLNDMFHLNLPLEDMHSIAASIGADCPAFLYETPVLATGTGTDITPFHLDLSGKTLAIAKPAASAVSTKEAYAGITPRLPKHSLPDLINLPMDQWQGKVKNDFEESIFPLVPEIRATKELMIDNGAIYASMSGSGAAVYGFFDDEEKAQSCLSKLASHTTFLCNF